MMACSSIVSLTSFALFLGALELARILFKGVAARK